jgi:hypothetical protein
MKASGKITSILLPLLVFVLPLQTRLIVGQGMINGNVSEYLTLSVYGIDLLIVLLVAVKIFTSVSSEGFKSTPTLLFQRRGLILGMLFVLWSVLSIFWAVDKLLAVQHVTWLFLAIGLAWLVMNYKNKAKLIFWLLMGLMVNAWLGIWQFVSQSTFANKWLGLAAHDPMLGGASIVEIYASDGSPIRWLRAYGSFDHPNIFGMAMVVGIILIVTELTQKKNGGGTEGVNSIEKKACHPEFISGPSKPRGWQFYPQMLKSQKNSLAVYGAQRVQHDSILYTALISMSAGLFASLSRSSWIGLVLGLGASGFYLFASANLSVDREDGLRNKLRNMVKPLAIIAIVFAIMIAIYPAQFSMRSGGDGRLETKSINDRVVYLEQSKNMIKENVLWGIGVGNYVEFLKNENSNNPAWTYQPVHNVFMLIWAELGLVGLLAFSILYVTIAMRACKKNPLGFCLLVSILPAMFLDHWFWSLHFGLLFFCLVFGLVLNKRFESM